MIVCNNYDCEHQSKRRTTITNTYGKKVKVHTCKLKTISLVTNSEMKDYFGFDCTKCVKYEQLPTMKVVK